MKHKIEAGAPIFIIGFPLGLRSEDYATPILRRGMVSRSDSSGILVDALVFAGNSGGPVVYAPSTPLGVGLSSPVLQGQWLVGLTTGYIPFIDVAISTNTKRPRVTFEENSGLCSVVPATHIMDLLESQAFLAIDTKTKKE